MNFGPYLKQLRKSNKDTLRSLAEKIGVNFTFIDRIEKELVPPSKLVIDKLIDIYPEHKKDIIEKFLNYFLTPNMKLSGVVKIMPDHIATLPVYGRASAGRGYINMDSPEYQVSCYDPNVYPECFYVEVDGNSMYPTLEDGDLALIDPRFKDTNSGGVYLICVYENAYIKRVQFKPKLRILTLKSDNPEYDDIDFRQEDFENIKVYGKVVKRIKEEKVR